MLASVYHTHTQSYVYYGMSLYGSTSNSNFDKTLKLQKRVIQIMLNLKTADFN